MPSPQLIRGASVAERGPAAMAREASDERGNHSSFRGYLYTQLRTYISLYVRPTDRLVEMSTSKLTQSLSLQTDRTLILGGGCFRDAYPCDVTQQLSEFKPDYVLLHGSVHYERDVQRLLEELRAGLPASSRIILVYYSTLWKPLLRLATALRLRRKTPEENWIANEDIWNLLLLAGYEQSIGRSNIQRNIRPQLRVEVTSEARVIPPFIACFSGHRGWRSFGDRG